VPNEAPIHVIIPDFTVGPARPRRIAGGYCPAGHCRADAQVVTRGLLFLLVQNRVLRFASEPVVADLDNNGRAEVIFTSWVQAVNLPAAFGSPTWNGGLAAPTLADIDGDSDLEVVLNTANSGFVAYDLPGTANARVLWGTGRGNYQRTGSLPTDRFVYLPLVLKGRDQ